MMISTMKSCRIQVISLILTGLISLPARAEVIPGRWEKVSDLALGTPITVDLKNGDQVVGDFEGLSASAVDIETRSARAVIPKSEIRTITTQEKGGVGKKAAVGAAIGAAVGAGIPLVAFARNGSSDQGSGGAALIVLIVAGVGAAIGGGLGAVAGVGTKMEATVIYKAPDIP